MKEPPRRGHYDGEYTLVYDPRPTLTRRILHRIWYPKKGVRLGYWWKWDGEKWLPKYPEYRVRAEWFAYRAKYTED